VARIQRRGQRVVQPLLAAGADGDLLRLVVEVVLALELGADRLLQRGGAVDVGVFGVAGHDRLDRGLLDVVRRVEIRLAGAQADDVSPGRLQLARLAGDGDGGRRFDAGQTLGDEGHDRSRQVGGKAGGTILADALPRNAESCKSGLRRNVLCTVTTQAVRRAANTLNATPPATAQVLQATVSPSSRAASPSPAKVWNNCSCPTRAMPPSARPRRQHRNPT